MQACELKSNLLDGLVSTRNFCKSIFNYTITAAEVVDLHRYIKLPKFEFLIVFHLFQTWHQSLKCYGKSSTNLVHRCLDARLQTFATYFRIDSLQPDPEIDLCCALFVINKCIPRLQTSHRPR